MSVFRSVHSTLHDGFGKALDDAKKHPAAAAVGVKAATMLM